MPAHPCRMQLNWVHIRDAQTWPDRVHRCRGYLWWGFETCLGCRSKHHSGRAAWARHVKLSGQSQRHRSAVQVFLGSARIVFGLRSLGSGACQRRRVCRLCLGPNLRGVPLKVADSIQLGPSDAERASIHKGFALEGRDRVSGAMCANLKAAPEARGHCFGTISGSGYTIVYTFDPVACGYDNIAVAGSLHARLSVGNRDDREPELDCATKLERFSVDIDNLLAQSPHNITDVFAVLDRHFPLHGCKVDVASDIMKKSRYFRSMTKSTLTTQVFSLSSATASSRGVHVSFGLTDSGESRLPSARWSPPFP